MRLTPTAGRLDSPPADEHGAGWHARLELGFESAAPGSTVLAHRSHVGPLRVQKALYPEGRRVCHSVIVHPPGGIAAGDRLEIDIRLAAHAHALVTTPGATKWYKTPCSAAAQSTCIRIARGAILEWLPQEAIVFNHANPCSTLDVTLAAGALFIGWDILCFGRTAAGETYAEGRYRQCWQIRQEHALLWNETGVLEGGSALMAAPAGMGGAPVCATLVAAGKPVDSALLDALRAEMAALPARGRIAATRLPMAVAVRYLGHSTEEARTALVAVWSILRPHLAGIEARPPRLWRT